MRGRNDSMSSSWKLESSQTTQDSSCDLADELRQRPPDVAGDRRAEHRAEQLARRRLPVRPGDAENRVREQSRAELDLAPDGHPALARGGDEGCLRRHPGALDQDVHSLQQRCLLGSEVDFDAGRFEPPDVDVLGTVDGDDAIASSGERQGGCLPRPREAEDEGDHWLKRSGRNPRRYW